MNPSVGGSAASDGTKVDGAGNGSGGAGGFGFAGGPGGDGGHGVVVICFS
jgi:hypothetical protein